MAVLKAAASASLVLVGFCLATAALADSFMPSMPHLSEAEHLRRTVAAETAALIERRERVLLCDETSYIDFAEQAALGAQIARISRLLKDGKPVDASQ